MRKIFGTDSSDSGRRRRRSGHGGTRTVRADEAGRSHESLHDESHRHDVLRL